MMTNNITEYRISQYLLIEQYVNRIPKIKINNLKQSETIPPINNIGTNVNILA